MCGLCCKRLVWCSISPTARTLEYLRADGWHAEVTERWVPGANIRKDLWTFCDILGLKHGQILAVQCTSDSNVAARVKKITDCELLPLVRAANISIQVIGWKKGRSVPRIVDLS